MAPQKISQPRITSASKSILDISEKDKEEITASIAHMKNSVQGLNYDDEEPSTERDQLRYNHAFFHEKNHPELAAEEEVCHFCQIRKFSDYDLYPISINRQNTTEEVSLDFTFIEHSVLLEGIQKNPDEFNFGCSCASELDCMKTGCQCLGDVEIPPGANENTKISAYHAVGPRKGLLRATMLNSRQPIYECHDKCACTIECPNRVVGRGRKVELEVFWTGKRGWGLRARNHIKKGQFVGEYVGEILTPEEANLRRSRAEDQGIKDVYMFALDKFTDPDSPDEQLRGEPYEIDGEYYSGPTRFINHSCDPNLRIFAVVTDHSNKRFHQLCFFALQDIERHTELTFDYVDGVNGTDDIKDMTGKQMCLCGSPNCRGYLW